MSPSILRKCAIKECSNTFKVWPSLTHRKKYCCRDHAHLGSRKEIIIKCIVCGKYRKCRPSELKNGRGKFCSNICKGKFYGVQRSNQVECKCHWCGKNFSRPQSHLKTGRGKFCSHRCRQLSRVWNTLDEGRIVKPEPEYIPISEGINWFLGIIASDGCLVQDRAAIIVVSKDIDLLLQVQEIVREEITGREYKITPHRRGKNRWWSLHFTSPLFYNFCLEIGLAPKKSFILEDLALPEGSFGDFLRGEIDGDGYIAVRTEGDRKYLRIRIASGSPPFLNWILNQCKSLFDVRGGSIYQVSGSRNCYELSLAHYDSVKVLKAIYIGAKHFLERKKKVFDRFLHL